MAKEKEVEEWGRRFQDMKANHQQLRHKLDSVERYLADLPTAEETQHNTQEISLVLSPSLVLNPLTAPAGQISGLKSAHTACKQCLFLVL